MQDIVGEWVTLTGGGRTGMSETAYKQGRSHQLPASENLFHHIAGGTDKEMPHLEASKEPWVTVPGSVLPDVQTARLMETILRSAIRPRAALK